MVVRVKDRFKHPSGGGWRDVMINYYVVIDGAKHVCEVQLVHKSLLTARKGLPGHIIYGVVRNATEVLEFLGLLIKFERVAGLRALVDAGWGREAIERLGLPPPELMLAERIDLSNKKLGAFSASFIASCIKANRVLIELKCAAAPGVRVCVSAPLTLLTIPAPPSVHSLENNSLGPEWGAALAEGVKGSATLQVLK